MAETEDILVAARRCAAAAGGDAGVAMSSACADDAYGAAEMLVEMVSQKDRGEVMGRVERRVRRDEVVNGAYGA